MNFLNQTLPQRREAKIRYLDADFQVILEGEYVRCGATGDPISLDNLRYWDVSRQLAFKSAGVAFGEYLKSLS
ncbi:DUF2093 domain-containing protein [Aestuariivirga sp.]|uniref:DUF2093 domain-containing protein n=1 Tax=Aestuariivirga sp. TaxID=2650926 RepID=UPI0035939580